MMGLDPGPLVRALFHFALENPLLVSVTWLWSFLLTGIESIGDVVLLFMFVPTGVESKGARLIELFWAPK